MNNLEYLKKYYQGDIKEAIIRLKSGEPIQYIVGNVDFNGVIIDVNKDVLIPRFETELLVVKLEEYIKKYLNEDLDILDIGTGSGCIAIYLKSKFLTSNVTGVDISIEALSLASSNAFKNKLDISFIKSDIFSNISGKFNVIVSNPPYISLEDEVELIVKDNEPSLALYASNNGLFFYEEILKNAISYLKDKFIIAFEIGFNQKKAVIELAKRYFKDAIIIGEDDLSNKNRYIFIIKN